MKIFVVFAVTLGCALANTESYLADSPDVAAAKLAHFEAKAKAAAAVGAAPDYVTSYYLNYYKNFNNAAAITVLPNGFLADTPEVTAAKNAHFAEFAKAAALSYAKDSQNNVNFNNANQVATNPKYYVPANIVVQPNGFLADTPEVSAAKKSFDAYYARALYTTA